ncbi:MAG: ketol-acid reductoisomerase [Puniceicoccaceae bacterium MED-G30]|jgi:ketol-acid reductoisomerase|nr:MAG: ketol-acid reductoisomerase [Puniceicoccaceae bacterium MED-G30]RPG87363.1 MAG: ketol-acid reductoisomerase [Coraliomargarita sp. TMED73]|tara:strand:+ start:1167 stop:2195 length:1029 start_codon:yes stop_codon:yes gene_type:complete
MPAKVYTDKDANLRVIKKKTLAIIGYGSQGHAHAQNLKDSGLHVIIGLYKKSKSVKVAKSQGFEVYETAEAVRRADVIMLAVPDMKQPEVYENDILPNLTKGKTLAFTHGLSIHYGLIEAPRGVDVIMVAPKGPGHVVRSQYVEGKGVPALIAVHKGSSRNAKAVALAWAKGVGGTRAGVLQTTFKEECETDLFGEQAVLCGGASALVQAGFETLVDAGYQPEMAYFECLHELKLIVDLMVESGVSGMRFSISETAEWGDYISGPRVINASSRKAMQSILKDIQSGKFTKNWVKEYKAGCPNYKNYIAEGEKHPIEKTGQRLRALMPWVKKRNIKGAQAAYN